MLLFPGDTETSKNSTIITPVKFCTDEIFFQLCIMQLAHQGKAHWRYFALNSLNWYMRELSHITTYWPQESPSMDVAWSMRSYTILLCSTISYMHIKELFRWCIIIIKPTVRQQLSEYHKLSQNGQVSKNKAFISCLLDLCCGGITKL